MITNAKSKSTRIYADTSVFGGMFDQEFETASKLFFNAVKKESFKLITSELVRQEIQVGPQKVLDILKNFLSKRKLPKLPKAPCNYNNRTFRRA